MLTRKELYNIPGWHTRRHLVVIESDDWGSIRTPSKAVYDEFLRLGIRMDCDRHWLDVESSVFNRLNHINLH